MDIYFYFDTVLKTTKPGNHHHPLVFNTYPQNLICVSMTSYKTVEVEQM